MLSVDDFASKVKSKYPEYQSLDNQTLTQKVIAKYPEYATQVAMGSSPIPSPLESPAIKSFLQNSDSGQLQGATLNKNAMSDFAQFGANVAKGAAEFGGQAVAGVGQGIGGMVSEAGQALEASSPQGVATNILNAAGAKLPTNQGAAAGGQLVKQGTDWLAGQVSAGQKSAGLNPESFAGQAGNVTGNIASQILPMILGGEAIEGANIATKYPILSTMAKKVAESAGSTAIMTGATEGRLPNPTELGLYGLLDVGGEIASKAGGELYKSSFKGAKGEKAFTAAYDKTFGNLAEEMGMPVGTPKQIAGQVGTAKKTVWDKIMEVAKTNGTVTRNQFVEKIGSTIQKAFKDMPDSQAKDELIQGATDIVNKYAPKTSATGGELVGTITQINKGLFGDGSKIILSSKQANSLVSEVKNGIKDMLPEEIKPLYEKYAKNLDLEKAIKDKRVKELLGKIGVGTGIGTLGTGAYELGQGKDPFTVMKDAVIGGIVGGLLQHVSGSALAKTTVGKTLKVAAPTTAIIIKSLIGNLESRLNVPNKGNEPNTNTQADNK